MKTSRKEGAKEWPLATNHNINLIFTNIAQTEMDDIWDYIAKDSVNAADRLVEEIQIKCLNIAQTPGIGQERPELASGKLEVA